MINQKVFCIGLSRTGTTSIHYFLQGFGFCAIHFPLSMFIHPEIIKNDLEFKFLVTKSFYGRWRAVKEIKALDKIIVPSNFWEEFNVFSDLPVPLYYKELAVKFPESKFIYTTRSLEGWLRSMQWMYEEGRILWKWGYINDEILYKTYGTTSYDQKLLTRVFLQHEKDVYKFFENQCGRLCIINLDDSKPFKDKICKFLNLSISKQEFPRINEKTNVSRKEKLIYNLSKNIPFFFLVNRLIKKKK